MDRLRGAMWLYPWDLMDEGPEVVMRRLIDQGGLSGILLAVCYHAGLFLLPHNPVRKLYFPLDGSVYYRPDEALHRSHLLQPLVHPMVRDADPLRVAVETGRRFGLDVAAWLVPTHNTRLGVAHPNCVQTNAYGDPHYPSLCPAHPEVRAYVCSVARDVARYAPSAIVVESVEYLPVEHGYHHEVFGIPLTPTASILLGMCFCDHCRRSAASNGVDAEAVRRGVTEALDAFFEGHGPAMDPELNQQVFSEFGGGQMAGYLKAREQVVTSLYAELSSAVKRSWSGALARIDFTPLRLGGIAGHRLRSGVDLAAIAPYIDRLDPTLYGVDAATIAHMLATYMSAVPKGARLMPSLRAIRPQAESKEALLAAIRVCYKAGIEEVSFYNYGFMRLETLGWIREALKTAND